MLIGSSRPTGSVKNGILAGVHCASMFSILMVLGMVSKLTPVLTIEAGLWVFYETFRGGSRAETRPDVEGSHLDSLVIL